MELLVRDALRWAFASGEDCIASVSFPVRPESVSRFSRCKSARSSAACW